MHITSQDSTWKPVLRLFSRDEDNILIEKFNCYITLLSATSADAVVMDEMKCFRAVSINWPDRPPYIVEFVSKTTAFRFDVCICNNDVHNLVLVVNPVVFEQQMDTGSILGEIYVVAIVVYMWKHAYIHPVHPLSPPTVESNETFFWGGTLRTPFEHQLRAWKWMRSIETEVLLGQSAFFHKNIHVSGTSWYVDPIRECLTQNSEIRRFEFKGGLLCDGSGLGKTATVLGIIDNDNRPDPNKTLTRYASGGTLVIVPINLPDQWCGEVCKYMKPGTTLQRLICKKDLHELTMEKLLAADVVVTTLSFLRASRPYLSAVEHEIETNLGEIERKDVRNFRGFRYLMRQPNITMPIVECVHWKRLVIDEAGDFMNNSREWKYITSLSCTLMWGITAAPDLRDHKAHALHSFLKYPDEHAYHPNLLAALVQKLVRGTRGTRGTHPTLDYVTLSVEEQQLFDAHGRSILPLKDTIERLSSGHLCLHDTQHLNVSGDGNDLEIRVMRMRFKRLCALLTQSEISIDNVLSLQRNIEHNINAFVKHGRSTSVICELQHQLHTVRTLRENTVKENCELLHSAIRRETQSINFIHSATKRLIQQSETCTICLERTCNCITPCGHLYCTKCIYTALQNNTQCPHCRDMVHPYDVCAFMPGQVSSKLIRLSNIIRNLSGDAIVFSQWMSTLRMLRATLRDHDKSVWILQGTTQSRAGILQSFSKHGGVLLVCLNQSFAGLHLPRVNTVIFAHPVVERSTAVESIEKQAVARALRYGNNNSVRVVVLVAPDCDEEILWKKQEFLNRLKH